MRQVAPAFRASLPGPGPKLQTSCPSHMPCACTGFWVGCVPEPVAPPGFPFTLALKKGQGQTPPPRPRMVKRQQMGCVGRVTWKEGAGCGEGGRSLWREAGVRAVDGTSSLSSQPRPVGAWPWGLTSLLKTHSPTWAPATLTFKDPQPRALPGRMADTGLGGQDLGVGGSAS